MMQRLKELRKTYGLSQKQLGNIIGVSQQTISHYETGAFTPHMPVAKIIANFFGVTIDELFENTAPNPEDRLHVICPFCIPRGYFDKLQELQQMQDLKNAQTPQSDTK
jgi:putative transcriptional regulator